MADYVARFPAVGTLKELPLQLVGQEYWIRHCWGEKPKHVEYLEQFPSNWSELRSILQDIDLELASSGAVSMEADRLDCLRKTAERTTGGGDDPGRLNDDEGDVGGTSREPGDLPGTFGKFVVKKLLGKGAFGRVYLGLDPDLRRPVAIKVPRPDRFKNPDDAAVFMDEARNVANLDHEGIVPVYHVGRTRKGMCFVVSKYVEGDDLAHKITQDQLSYVESAEIIAAVADALHHAHLNGLVHRDIKPANILLDVNGKPYVADFGLSMKDEDFGKWQGLVGTPAYMSPEQARGDGYLVDGRSDIFGLGAVFYELLVGRRPFRGDGVLDIGSQICEVEPKPPRQIDDTLPADLEDICLKALSKRITERYTTGRDMADAIREWIRRSVSSGA